MHPLALQLVVAYRAQKSYPTDLNHLKTTKPSDTLLMLREMSNSSLNCVRPWRTYGQVSRPGKQRPEYLWSNNMQKTQHEVLNLLASIAYSHPLWDPTSSILRANSLKRSRTRQGNAHVKDAEPFSKHRGATAATRYGAHGV